MVVPVFSETEVDYYHAVVCGEGLLMFFLYFELISLSQ